MENKGSGLLTNDYHNVTSAYLCQQYLWLVARDICYALNWHKTVHRPLLFRTIAVELERSPSLACNWFQMQLGGGRRSVKIAVCSSRSRRTYGKIGDCEKAN